MAKISINRPTDSGKIPLTNVLLRVKSEPEYHISEKSGGRSLKVTLEIAEPAEVSDAQGNLISIAGKEITQFLPVSGKGLFRFQEFHAALRDNSNPIPEDIELDDESGLPIGIEYTGMQLWAQIRTSTQEQQSGGVVVLNPLNGKPMENSRLDVTKFITNS